jgi:hypothetical protein
MCKLLGIVRSWYSPKSFLALCEVIELIDTAECKAKDTTALSSTIATVDAGLLGVKPTETSKLFPDCANS